MANQNKFETFRDWVIEQDQYHLWLSDADVHEIMENNPKGKFRDYMKKLKDLEVPVIEENQTETSGENTMNAQMMGTTADVNEAAEIFSEKESLVNALSEIENVVDDSKAMSRIMTGMEAEMYVQGAITHGSVVTSNAATVVSKTSNWARKNPKTATAVGVATVVAAGVGIYHLAKTAKQYI